MSETAPTRVLEAAPPRRNPDYAGLEAVLRSVLPAARIVTDPLRRRVFGIDASFYRLVPRLVLLAENEAEVVEICRAAARHATPLTFRAAGTSLSGQAVTDSVLVRLGHDGWRRAEVGEAAAEIRLEPGLTGAQANARLAPHGRKIGPDPASINAAMIGGIAANNASGMCCGVAQNSYHTLKSMRVVLADGSVVDTGSGESRADLARARPDLLAGLESLGARTKADPRLAARIRDKFKIKNTTGYSLNALVDFEDPFEILEHLMIGSEGTLGFISEITYRTVEDPPKKASALAFFPDMEQACQAAAKLRPTPVAAVEIMDRAALRAVENRPKVPAILKDLPAAAAALLIEIRAADSETLWNQVEAVSAAIADIPLLEPLSFTDKPEVYGPLWAIRKGMFPSVGAMRETGTTVIIEDVAVEIGKLAAAVRDLQALFVKHGYDEAIVFGHALEGNVHFVFTQAFDSPAEVRRYGDFMNDVADLIVTTYDGSLKAEHSTGRNMAPFVEMEWGLDAYALMREIKALFDPDGLLNPGVILNPDPNVHLQNLKPMPAADEGVDKCIECGFCEPNCPSRALTLTPRQRIAGLREFHRGAGTPDEPDVTREDLESLYDYQGVATCAGDGLCSLACPVGIDTGEMMRALRAEAASPLAGRIAALLARRFGLVVTMTRLGLFATGILRGLLGRRLFASFMEGVRSVTGGRMPLVPASIPRSSSPPVARIAGDGRPRLVYLPSCASRTMGPGGDDPERASLHETVQNIFDRAGYELVHPPGLDGLCCGMPFESKGLFAAADSMSGATLAALEAASEGGKLPIVVDTSPCTLRLLRVGAGSLRIMDLTQAIAELVLPKLSLRKTSGPVALHATCSTRRMGLEETLQAIAEACADEVVVPDDIQCCGFAGDKGFMTPEINESALRHLSAALPETCREGFSSSRTCEIGLSHHAGRPYRSIAYLVERCAREADEAAGSP